MFGFPNVPNIMWTIVIKPGSLIGSNFLFKGSYSSWVYFKELEWIALARNFVHKKKKYNFLYQKLFQSSNLLEETN